MVTLSPAAADKVKELLEREGNGAQGLRLFITGGGCSGYSYGLTFEDAPQEDDTVSESHGVKIFVDAMSLPLVDGSEIDYVEGLMGSGFSIRNPNAVATCGCGHSFATEESEGGCGCGCCS